MRGSMLSRLARTAVQIVFAWSVLLPSQAQDLVRSWTGPGVDVTFQANGRWFGSDTNPTNIAGCGGSKTGGGTYIASAGTLSMTLDRGACGPDSYAGAPQFIGSGTYAISGSTMVVHLQSPDGAMDFTLTEAGATTPPPVTPATLLPPPPVVQTVYTVASGEMPAAAVQVSATGTFGNASLTVTLDIARVLQAAAATGFAASTYNVYVVAMIPGALLGSAAPVFYVRPKAPGNWSPLQMPIAPYLDNVAQDSATSQVMIEILSNADISSLVGTEVYIGYGTSDTEMLAAKRYRGIYKAE